jgi:hypothetical protein
MDQLATPKSAAGHHALPLSFIKTSHTRNINDLAPSSIGNVPVRF